MKKKMLSLVLVATLVLSLVACSTKETPETKVTEAKTEEAQTGEVETEGANASAIDFDEEPYVLKVCYAVMSEAQPDLALIEEKLNEITLREINAKVELEAVSLFNMANIYALKASSQEQMDLIMLMPGNTYMANFANSNLIKPIDAEVEEWGAAIVDSIGDTIKAGQFQGLQYGIPVKREPVPGYGFTLLQEMVDKYDIDPSAIKSYEDMDAIFEMIQAGEPEMSIIMPEGTGGSIVSVIAGKVDSLGTVGGVLMNGGLESTEIVNYHATEEFMNACKKVREWYEKGYISKDVATTQESGSRIFDGGNLFAVAVASVNREMKFALPIPGAYVLLEEPIKMTSDEQLFMWAVPNSAARPDKSVQFVNLMSESVELTTLMRFGIEGIHYEQGEQGVVVPTEQAPNYRNSWYMFGDYERAPLLPSNLEVSPDGTAAGYRQLDTDWNERTRLSKAYGFTFDTTAVVTEIASVTAVNDEFMVAIGNGVVDPEIEIPKFLEKLEAAGIQRIIDEQQRQLDEWLATQ